MVYILLKEVALFRRCPSAEIPQYLQVLLYSVVCEVSDNFTIETFPTIVIIMAYLCHCSQSVPTYTCTCTFVGYNMLPLLQCISFDD